ncbi:hypothetical protein C5E45_19970 [Nocardia nova]|uniref:Uncharacterized protein n=1 Tax=Nocardia nova TaxID=37330 RepID=A0A2S6AM73_9NOCA|nr:hypothetical protein [Nocardia nova]PPJ36334.1 hypothetical protein C5E45_19970 [Nocardia nova]
MDYSDDDIFAEDWDDPDTRRARSERALDLVDLLKTLLQAVATRMDKPSAAYKRSYHDDQRSLAGILKLLGIGPPINGPLSNRAWRPRKASTTPAAERSTPSGRLR